MESQDSKRSAQAMALAFLDGAIAGAVAGILLAPRSGEETRRELSRYARKAEKQRLGRGHAETSAKVVARRSPATDGR